MKNKKVIIISSIVIGVLVLTLGITYSIFTFNVVGKNSNLVVGDIYMHYNEPTRELSITNAYPLSEYRVDTSKLQTCVNYLNEKGLILNQYVVSKEAYQNCSNRYDEYIFGLTQEYGENNYQALPLEKYCPTFTYEDYCSGKTLTYQGPTSLEDGHVSNEDLEAFTNSYFYGDEFEREAIYTYNIIEDYKDRRDMGHLNQEMKTYLKDNGVIVSDLPGTSYFEFTVDGKNTHTTDAINYRIWLSRGDTRSGTRIGDKFLTFKLTEVNNGVETVLKDNLEFATIDNSTVYYDIVQANTTSEIVKTYRLYMWLNDDVRVCGGELTDGCDYTMDEWNNAYASIKVNVDGEYQKSANFAQYIKSRYNSSKQDGLVAINTNGDLASSSDTIREYRYNGIGNYCTYAGVNGDENWSALDNTCPQNVFDGSETSTRVSFQNDIFATRTLQNIGAIKDNGNYFTRPINTKNNQTTPTDSGLRNYIMFNNEMWRIVGVFNEENADGVKEERIKLVKDEPLLANSGIPESITKNGITYQLIKKIDNTRFSGTTKYEYFYWNNPDSNYTGTLNDWTKSGIMYYLNDNYLNSLSNTDLIENMKYYLDGEGQGNEFAFFEGNDAYNAERGINQETKTDPWNGKVALLYESDVYYASSQNVDNISLSANYNWLMNNDIVSGLWLLGKSYDSEDMVSSLNTSINLSVEAKSVNEYDEVRANTAVRPVVTLKANTVVASGDGSFNNPYRIKTN